MWSAKTVFLSNFPSPSRVFQPHDPVGFFLELFFDIVVGAGGVSDVEPSLIRRTRR